MDPGTADVETGMQPATAEVRGVGDDDRQGGLTALSPHEAAGPIRRATLLTAAPRVRPG